MKGYDPYSNEQVLIDTSNIEVLDEVEVAKIKSETSEKILVESITSNSIIDPVAKKISAEPSFKRISY